MKCVTLFSFDTDFCKSEFKTYPLLWLFETDRIESPFYPDLYPNDIECSLIMEMLATYNYFYVTFIDVEIDFDDRLLMGIGSLPKTNTTVRVTGGKSENSIKSVTFNNSTIWILFETNHYRRRRGFAINVQKLRVLYGKGKIRQYFENGERGKSLFNMHDWYNTFSPDCSFLSLKHIDQSQRV